jgi:endonuclease-3
MAKNPEWAKNLIDILSQHIHIDRERFISLRALEGKDSFKLLIATILSQNTNDKNSIRAYMELEKNIGIEPRKLMDASLKDIIRAIKVGGLYRNKARAIKEISKIILEKYGGDISRILKLDLEKARNELLSLPNVGPKTADILLLFIAGHPVFPVDTHILRITRRIGLVERATYKEVSERWKELLPQSKYMEAHHLLIALGRKICQARKPVCSRCPINNLCDYYKELYQR